MVLTMVLRQFGDGFDNDFDDGLTMVRQWFGDAFSDGLLVCWLFSYGLVMVFSDCLAKF